MNELDRLNIIKKELNKINDIDLLRNKIINIYKELNDESKKEFYDIITKNNNINDIINFVNDLILFLDKVNNGEYHIEINYNYEHDWYNYGDEFEIFDEYHIFSNIRESYKYLKVLIEYNEMDLANELADKLLNVSISVFEGDYFENERTLYEIDNIENLLYYLLYIKYINKEYDTFVDILRNTYILDLTKLSLINDDFKISSLIVTLIELGSNEGKIKSYIKTYGSYLSLDVLEYYTKNYEVGSEVIIHYLDKISDDEKLDLFYKMILRFNNIPKEKEMILYYYLKKFKLDYIALEAFKNNPSLFNLMASIACGNSNISSYDLVKCDDLLINFILTGKYSNSEKENLFIILMLSNNEEKIKLLDHYFCLLMNLDYKILEEIFNENDWYKFLYVNAYKVFDYNINDIAKYIVKFAISRTYDSITGGKSKYYGNIAMFIAVCDKALANTKLYNNGDLLKHFINRYHTKQKLVEYLRKYI